MQCIIKSFVSLHSNNNLNNSPWSLQISSCPIWKSLILGVTDRQVKGIPHKGWIFQALPWLFKQLPTFKFWPFSCSCLYLGASTVLLRWLEVLLGQQVWSCHGGLPGLCPAIQRRGGKRRHRLLPPIQVRYMFPALSLCILGAIWQFRITNVPSLSREFTSNLLLRLMWHLRKHKKFFKKN